MKICKNSTELTPREEFNSLVKARDLNKCVFCGAKDVVVHHIMDRSLFPDGGYDVDNGACVCSDHHWECEITIISPKKVREACGIEKTVLPPGFDQTKNHDKWGNEILDDKTVILGPLGLKENVKKCLIRSGTKWRNNND